MKRAISIILCIISLFALSVSAHGEKEDTKTESKTTVGSVRGLLQDSATQNSIVLSWEKVKKSDGYRVYMLDEKTDKFSAAVKNTSNESAEIKGLKAGKSYVFKVRAYQKGSDGKKIWGEYSKEVSAVTSPPKVTSVTSSDIELDSITLSWASSHGADGYQIYIYDKQKGKFAYCGYSEKCTFTASSLEENTLYTFKVRAVRKKNGYTAVGELSKSYSEFTHKTGTPLTNAQAAKVYNKAVNKAKSTKNMTVKHTKKINTSALSCSKYSLFSTVSAQMSLLDGKISKKYTFKDGKSSGVTPNLIIEPISKSAAIRGCDIKSFSASSKDGVFTLKLKLKAEDASFNGKTTAEPKRHKRVISTVKLENIVTTPIKVRSAVQSFSGAQLTIKTKSGKLTELKIKDPVRVDAKCKVSTLSFDTEAAYTTEHTLKFSY